MARNMSLEKNPMPVQDAAIRAKNFDEVALGYTEKVAMLEAARCLGCKNHPCVDGCPVKIHIPAFIAEVAKGNFEEAEKYLHPDYNENSLKEYFDNIEAEYDIDFQSGIALLGYSGVYSSYYTTEVDGSLYEIYHELEVSGERITAYIAIIENDNGYGIGDIVIE